MCEREKLWRGYKASTNPIKPLHTHCYRRSSSIRAVTRVDAVTHPVTSTKSADRCRCNNVCQTVWTDNNGWSAIPLSSKQRRTKTAKPKRRRRKARRRCEGMEQRNTNGTGVKEKYWANVMLQMLKALAHVRGSECAEERPCSSRWTAERGVEIGWEEADVRHAKAPDATPSTGRKAVKGMVSMTNSKCEEINAWAQSGGIVPQWECENQQNQPITVNVWNCTCHFICRITKCQVLFQWAL